MVRRSSMRIHLHRQDWNQFVVQENWEVGRDHVCVSPKYTQNFTGNSENLNLNSFKQFTMHLKFHMLHSMCLSCIFAFGYIHGSHIWTWTHYSSVDPRMYLIKKAYITNWNIAKRNIVYSKTELCKIKHDYVLQLFF